MTAPAAGKAVAFPARAQVSIVYDKHLVSQVFPAGIPVEEFFEEMVELLDGDLKRRGLDGVELAPGSYELHKVNGVRLDISRSLDELGVQDGNTLVLVPAEEGDSFEPQYESLSTALAAMGKRLGETDRVFAPVTALTAARTAIGILAMATAVVIALTLRARTFTDNLMPAAVCGAVAALLVVCTVVVRRGWPGRRDLFSGFGWLATAATATAAAVMPPGPLGAPHVLIGAVTVAMGALAISVLSRSQTAVVTGLVTVCGVGVLVAVARMWQPVSVQVLGIWLLCGLLLLVRFCPVIALWVASIRPPHFGSITGRDVFARRDGMPLDTVSPVGEDEDEDDELTDISARGALIEASARLVNAVQLGICAAAATMLPVAVWMVLVPGQPRQWQTVLLAGLVAGIFLMQGRAYTAKFQAIALVYGSTGAVMAAVIKYATSAPGDSAAGLSWPVLVVGVFAALGLAAALLVPAAKFIPFIRLLVEWIEVFAIIAALPLAAWLGGLFAWVRN